MLINFINTIFLCIILVIIVIFFSNINYNNLDNLVIIKSNNQK